MTTAIAEAPVAFSAPRRIRNAMRIHAANPWTTLIVPWIIMAAIFLTNFAIWHIVLLAAGDRPVDPGAFQQNGGVTWIFVYMVVVSVQAMNQTFRFAVGLSATRRDYYLGTVAHFSMLSLMYGLGIAFVGLVEGWTGGWGVDGAFFAPPPLSSLSHWAIAYVVVVFLLLMFSLGAAVGAVFVRWGANGILTFSGSLAALAVGAAFLVTRADGWGGIGRFFTDTSLVGIASWSLPLTVVCGAVGYALLRRATPRD